MTQPKPLGRQPADAFPHASRHDEAGDGRAAGRGRFCGGLYRKARLRRASRLAKAGHTTRAFAILAPLARRGCAEAQFAISQAYLQETGVPRSRHDAFRWCEAAARQGLVTAQSLLAGLHLEEVGAACPTRPSFLEGQHEHWNSQAFHFDAAFTWARRAEHGGSADAKALLGYLYLNGPEASRDLVRSDSYYRESAEGGSVQGALGHGLALMRQAEGNASQAVGWIEKAAEGELPYATYLLGFMREHGIGCEQDLPCAMKLYQRSAERGIAQGQARWGTALIEGKLVSRNPVAGESWLRRAALAGDADAAARVGMLYLEDEELPANGAEAATWLTRAALDGHALAARKLAQLHLNSVPGFNADPDEGLQWLRHAAELGDEAAREKLANLVMQGIGTTEDRSRTRFWLQNAAEAGDAAAAFRLGIRLLSGPAAERCHESAASWMHAAAAHLVEARYCYGRMLCDGLGVAADLEAGRRWISEAADGGSRDAMVMLGEMMVNGRGGPAEPLAAFEMFLASAQAGHPGAAFAAGIMLSGDHGIANDHAAAQGWFRRAAEQGHAHAQRMLGRYLAHAIAGEYDLNEARYWLSRAEENGLAEAALELEAIPSRAAPEDQSPDPGVVALGVAAPGHAAVPSA